MSSDKEITHKYTDKIVCPYCGEEIQDSWDYNSDSGELDCDECGREFSYSRDYEVTYTTTKKDCKDSGVEHDFIFDKEYDRKQKYGKNKETGIWERTSLPLEEHEHVVINKCSKCDAIDYKSTPIEKKEEV